MNDDKTELIWFGSRSNLKELTQAETILQLSSTTIEPAAVVWNLGVYMDNELNMQVYIGKVTAICIFHLRRLCQLRFVLTSSSMLRLISPLTISRKDCCNSVLYGLPTIILARAFRVAAPRTWNNLPLEIRSTTSTRTFHQWLKTHLFDSAYH